VKLPHWDAPPEALTLVRRLVFATWFLRVAFKPLDQLALIPSSLFQPVGIMALVPSPIEHLLHTAAVLYAVKLLTLLAIALVIAGVALRPSMVAASVLMTVFTCLWRGFAGHMDHESVLILFAGYLLTLFALADAWADRKGEPTPPGGPTRSGIPLTAILFMLCLVYTMVAIFRTVRGTPDVYTSGSLAFWALRNAYETAEPAWGWGKYVLQYPWLGHMLNGGFPIITLFEITAFTALFSRWYRYAFLSVMVPFHILSLFVLDVFFWENMVLYVLFFELGRRARQEPSLAPR
jgi:uncharacterized membrane protein YphA (DoxX/SURF4 family)